MLRPVGLWILPFIALVSAEAEPYQYIGAGGCASSNCHGGTRALKESDSRILGTEYSIWFFKDKHYKAYKALENERSQRMAEILNIGNPQTSQKCLVCHAAGSPAKSVSDGVACEACHGPAEKWLGPHTQPNSHAASVASGMIDERDLLARANNCLGCHLGDANKVVDHEMIAAGHPDLVFEMDTFSAAQPMHYRDPKAGAGNTLPRVRAWAVGQAAALAQGMRQLALRAAANWPEFSELECYQCHHDLRADSWRIRRGYPGRKPGSAQLNLSRFDIVRKLVTLAARDQAGSLDSALSQLSSLVSEHWADGPAIAQAARSLTRRADELAGRFARQDFDVATARALVKTLNADIARIAGSGVQSAEQATMSLDALLAAISSNAPAYQAAIGKLYDYLEHPSTFQPGDFAAQFHKVAVMAE